MLSPLPQLLVALCSTSPVPAATAKVSAQPQHLLQPLTANFSWEKPSWACQALPPLGIGRIVQLEHPVGESGGISEATAYNTVHPSAPAPPARGAGTPSQLCRARTDGWAFLPHLSLLQLLLLLHLQFFSFKDDRKNQNHEGGGPNPQSCPRESIKDKEP